MATTTTTENQTRIALLKNDAMGRHGSFIADLNPFLRDVALWRVADGGRSRVQVRAAFLLELVRLAPIEIRPGWSLAGEHIHTIETLSFAFAPDSKVETTDRIAELGVAQDEVARVREAVRRWASATAEPGGASVGLAAPDLERGRGSWCTSDSNTVFWGLGWIECHSVRDFAKVLRIGFQGVRHEVERAMAQIDPADADYPERENFWRAALDVCDAGILLGKRYADLAAEMALRASDPADRARLERMAEACARVPAQGARTFAEATQALWLAHVLTCGEDGINANSIGRLDQILYPWYAADLESGRLTRAEALEIMEEFACKLYLDYDVQAITLGGLDREGRNAANDLSAIILEATRNVDFVRDVSVRLRAESPPEFVALACELIVRGGGIPFIFNDDCFVPALAERGIAIEDARDYAPIGCIELTIPGRANPHAVSGWFSGAKCLELALFGGADPRSGAQLGPETPGLEACESFDDLLSAYDRQVECFARRMVYHCNRGELAQRDFGPLPCWSALTDACIERGRDITNGGALYNYHSVCFLGAANVADSLMALKKLLFDEKRVDARTLLDALRTNFAEGEALRQMLLNEAPKYGNDIREVDALARRACEQFIALMDQMRSPLGGRYFVHLFSFLCNIQFGKDLGATPDGRRAGEPLAYSLSAQQGRDAEGATAMLNSLARLPHARAAGASAAIIELDPTVVAGRDGLERFTQLVRGALKMGVGQMQWNITTAERLRQAQADPERYGNLAVRVAGFSQMFKLLDCELQNHIIARTKHRR